MSSITNCFRNCCFEPDIIFIGAGPVALWTATQTKLRNSTLNILMFEKHAKYQRTQPLRVSPSSFESLNDEVQFHELVASVSGEEPIPIQQLESRLKKLAIRCGVIIRYEEITKPEKLKERFKNCKVFIGSDGAHSKIGNIIFNNNYLRRDFRYTLQVRYRVSELGENNLVLDIRNIAKKYMRSRFSIIREIRDVAKFLSRMTYPVFQEGVNKNVVTVRFNIPEEVYVQVSQAREKSIFTLDDGRIPEDLKRDIYFWLGVRQEQLKEKRLEYSDEVTAFPLRAHKSIDYAKIDPDDTHWGLLGDAAATFPFELGLKVGLRCGTKLSKELAKVYSEADFKLSSYDTFVKAEVEANEYVANSINTQLGRFETLTFYRGIFSSLDKPIEQYRRQGKQTTNVALDRSHFKRRIALLENTIREAREKGEKENVHKTSLELKKIKSIKNNSDYIKFCISALFFITCLGLLHRYNRDQFYANLGFIV